LLEVVYHNRFYVAGTIAELRNRLSEHACRYATVKELLEDMAPK